MPHRCPTVLKTAPAHCLPGLTHTLTVAALLAAGLGASSLACADQIISNSYVFTSSGKSAGTDVNLAPVFKGTSWTNQSNTTSLMTGDQHTVIVPATPGTPAVVVPGIPAVVIPGFCVLGICSPATTITPAVPGYTIPGIPGTPAVIADTRNGASVTATSSGKVGATLSASVGQSTVTANLPVTSTLSLTTQTSILDHDYYTGVTSGDPSKKTIDLLPLLGTSAFQASFNATIAAGATLTTSAPTTKASATANIAVNNSYSAKLCVTGSCQSVSIPGAGVKDTSVELATVDSTRKYMFSVLGAPVIQSQADLKQGVPGLTVEGSTLDGTSASFDGQKFSYKATQTLLSTIAAPLELIPVVGSIFSTDLPIGTYYTGTVAEAQFTTVNATINDDVTVTQSYSFTPTLQATLTFSEPVGMVNLRYSKAKPSGIVDYNWKDLVIALGTSVTIESGENINLVYLSNADGTPNTGTLLSETYSIADTSHFTGKTTIDLLTYEQTTAACGGLQIDGLIDSKNQCVLDIEKPIASTRVAGRSADTSLGFNTITRFESDPAQNDPATVPEAGSVWLLLIGAAGLLISRARKAR
ncbi:hypothetical protein [Massilia sp. DWR3-1-1]|uniref:hypothetical protein n=1 Tax=Massilia sp. DWR3-1-1 TaxID=2804559 RepID=UPI003CF7F3AE